jgi:hypothetical protein
MPDFRADGAPMFVFYDDEMAIAESSEPSQGQLEHSAPGPLRRAMPVRLSVRRMSGGHCGDVKAPPNVREASPSPNWVQLLAVLSDRQGTTLLPGFTTQAFGNDSFARTRKRASNSRNNTFARRIGARIQK